MSKQLAAGEPAVQSALRHYLQCADSPDRYGRLFIHMTGIFCTILNPTAMLVVWQVDTHINI